MSSYAFLSVLTAHTISATFTPSTTCPLDMLNVSDAFNQIEQELNLIGQQVDQSDILLYLSRAVAYLSTTYALPTAKRSFNTVFFNGVRQVAVPYDFGTLIEPKRPPQLRSPRFMGQTPRELNTWPYGRKLSVSYEGSNIYLDVVDNVDSGALLIASCDDTTGVTLGGDGSGLSADSIIYTEGLGSLRFTVAAATGQTTISFALSSSFDISDFLTKDWIFADLIAPDTNTVNIASIVLRIGNDASNYYEMTATTRYRGDAIQAGINQVGFDLTARTTTGTVTPTAVDYLEVIINHGLTGVNGVYRLDNIFMSQGIFFEVPYYSIYNIQTAAGVRKETIDNLTDVILLPVQCNEAVIYKAMELIAASPNVKDQNFANFCARELVPKEQLLNSLYPSERLLIQSQWYKRTDFRHHNARRYF